jgi:hypothetical protein
MKSPNFAVQGMWKQETCTRYGQIKKRRKKKDTTNSLNVSVKYLGCGAENGNYLHTYGKDLFV